MSDLYLPTNWYWKVKDTFGSSMNDSFCKVRLPCNLPIVLDDNVGGSAHTWTQHDNAQITTLDKVFGSGSLLLDGTGDFADTPDTSDVTLGSGDFTIHFWLKPDAGGLGNLRRVAGHADAGLTAAGTSWYFEKAASNFLTFKISDGASFSNFSLGNINTATSFRHIMVARSGNTIKAYTNGVLTDFGPFTGTVPDSAGNIAVGCAGSNTSNPWWGKIDHFQIDVGVARNFGGVTFGDIAFEPPLFPDGQVFKTAGGIDAFVDATTDSDYLTWLANGNVATEIATAADLWALFNDYAKTQYHSSSYINANQTSNVALTLPSPPDYIWVLLSGGASSITLPKVRSPRSYPIGTTVNVYANIGPDPIRFVSIKNLAGNTLATIDRAGYFAFRLTANDTPQGSWTRVVAVPSTSDHMVKGLRAVQTNTTTYSISFNSAITREFSGEGQMLRRTTGLTCDVSLGTQIGGKGTLSGMALGAPIHYWLVDGENTGGCGVIADNVGPDHATNDATTIFSGGQWSRKCYLFTVPALDAFPHIPDVYVNGNTVFYKNPGSARALSAGATVGGTPTTAVSLANFVPACADTVLLQLYVQDTGGVTQNQAVLGAASGVVEVSAFSTIGGLSAVVVEVPNISQTIYYNNSIAAGRLYIDVVGYTVPNGG